MPPIGVLFVHGIGTQVRGRTLVDWGGRLASWLTRWRAGSNVDAQPAARLSDATLAPNGDEAPRVTLSVDGASVLLVESYWADTVLPPTYIELLQWALLIVPWTVASHFLARLRASQRGGLAVMWNVLLMLVALLSMPLLLAALVVILALGLVPVPQVRAVAAALQRGLAATFGDSLVLLNNEVQRAAIVSRVGRDLRWLATQCPDEIVVVAHSQGAAIAHAVLRDAHVRSSLTLVTFGSGITKLLEGEWLMRRRRRIQWVPWLFSAGAALIAIGLWRSVPALWLPEMRWRVAFGCAAFVVGIAILALIQNWIPRWLVLLLSVLNTVPLIVVLWTWFDKSNWALLLVGAQFALGLAFQIVASEMRPKPEPLLQVKKWLDLHASNDPVPSGALFEKPPCDVYKWIRDRDSKVTSASLEVSNIRSAILDHTSYWASIDDFVAKVACVVASLASVAIVDTSRADDLAQLQRACLRRRWRTGWLSAARAGLIVLAFVVVARQGLTDEAATLRTGGGLMSLQRNATTLAAGAISVLTPDFVQREVVGASAPFATSPGVVRTASLLLAILTFTAGWMLIAWRWRAWDRLEVTQLFERRNAQVLGVEFVIFLMVAGAVFEVLTLTAIGWIPSLRFASPAEWQEVMIGLALLAFAGAYPWLMRAMWLLLKGKLRSSTVLHGFAAAAVVCLLTAPIVVRDAAQQVAAGHAAPQTARSAVGNAVEKAPAESAWQALVGKRPALFYVIVAVWLVSVSRIWRRLEPSIARRSHSQVATPVVDGTIPATQV